MTPLSSAEANVVDEVDCIAAEDDATVLRLAAVVGAANRK